MSNFIIAVFALIGIYGLLEFHAKRTGHYFNEALNNSQLNVTVRRPDKGKTLKQMMEEFEAIQKRYD